MNSLNLSLASIDKDGGKFKMKINAVLKTNSHIILLQDTRVGNNVTFLKNYLMISKFGNYDIYLNSTKGDRGVITMIKRNFCHKVYRIFKSRCENVLIVDLHINNERMLIINCYGPTQSQNKDFYSLLKQKIESIGISKFVILGDLNCLTCDLPINSNVVLNNYEILNMSAIPNLIHTKTLVSWIRDGFIVDKFRLLYPNLKTYSYIPFSEQAINRSRIDHCLASPQFSPLIKKVEYPNRLSKYFDHKPVTLFGKSKNITRPKVIDSSLLNIEHLYSTVKFSVYSFMVDNTEPPNKNELTLLINRINILSLYIQGLEKTILKLPNDKFCKHLLEVYSNEIEENCSLFPSIETFLSYNTKLEPDLMLECLLNEIKNTCISFQSFYVKTTKEEKHNLSDQLSHLRSIGDFNSVNFKEIEAKLLEIEHRENLRLLENTNYFNLLNHEKSTRSFSELLKNKNSHESLSSIKDYSGNIIQNDNERQNFIVNHFKQLFSTPVEPEISFEEFFERNENDPIFDPFKLSQEDKLNLESPIQMSELETVLKNANLNAAVGLDGIPMASIKHFWDLIKDTMLHGFNYMANKGELRGMMNISRSNLIPKGGDKDLSNIKNWRSIGILTSPYKLYSGVINLRLKTVVDSIIHNAQKAYSDQYFIQECLINVYELLSKSNSTNSPLASLIIDFSRAFDTIGNTYLQSVLHFSNFGPKFILMVSSTFKNRKSCILTDCGLTQNFENKIGIIQGDLPSPNLFKIAINPLVIKLCLSNTLKIPNSIPYNFNRDENKVNVASGFADDMQNFMEVKSESLQKCYDILTSFGKLSNLKVNNSKTQIIITGGLPSLDFIRKVEELNFEISDNFTILGLSLHKSLNDTNLIWDKILAKVVKLRNFWNLFNLSIPGRVSIIKTYFYSQLSYLGSIFEPTDQFLADFEKCVVGFLKQGGRIAKDRIFLDCSKGGLGLPNPKEFLTSLKVSIFLKGLKANDSWGKELRQFIADPENPLSIQIDKIIPESNPILYNLVKAFLRFCDYYWKFSGNILAAQVVNNHLFTDNQGNMINNNFFTINSWLRYGNELKNLTLSNFISNFGNVLNYDEFCRKSSCYVTPNEFIRMKHNLRVFLNRCKTKFSQKSVSILVFISKPNLRAKDFRYFLDISKSMLTNCQPVKTRNMWLSNEIDINRESRFMCMWRLSYLPMNIRDFAFKLSNNLLHFNANLSKFSDTSPACTQCTIALNLPTPRETSCHFYLYCSSNTELLLEYFNTFLYQSNITWVANYVLLGAPSNIPFYKAIIINTEIIISAWFLFECRNKKIKHVLSMLKEFLKNFRAIFMRFPKYQNAYNKWIRG